MFIAIAAAAAVVVTAATIDVIVVVHQFEQFVHGGGQFEIRSRLRTVIIN